MTDSSGPTVADVGEQDLIARLGTVLSAAAPPDKALVRVGIGDDAAVLTPSPGSLALTCDMLVEGVHFLRGSIAAEELGHKALAVNLSDLAAMGAAADYALVSMALPGDLPVSFVEGVYRGLGRLASRWRVNIVGGDTVGSTGPVVIDVTAIGRVLPGGPFLAAAARAGDLLCVTGNLGASAAGLALSMAGRSPHLPEASAAALRRAHFSPEPRLAEAAVLAELTGPGGRRAARDLSDGLAVGAWLMAEASGCGVELWADRIPVSEATREAAAALGLDVLELALYGGEDYELLFTATEAELPEIEKNIPERTATMVTPIGRVTGTPGVRLVERPGRVRELPRRGFEHFPRGGVPAVRGGDAHP